MQYAYDDEQLCLISNAVSLNGDPSLLKAFPITLAVCGPGSLPQLMLESKQTDGRFRVGPIAPEPGRNCGRRMAPLGKACA